MATASQDNTACVWDILFPPAGPPEAELLARLAEALGGYTLSLDTDAPTPLPEPWRLRETLGRDAARLDDSSPAVRLVRWALADPWKRTISPLSKVTVEEWIQRRLAEGHREEAERVFPGHPLLAKPK